MIRSIAFIGSILFAFSLSAQIEDRTETNCEGESRSIYQVGDEGKPLIIASKGFDCSICQGQADDVALFAAQNEGSIEVWGAMTYTYSSATPTCVQVNNWSETYNWTEIFAFPDVDEYWLEFGTPRYYVIHPETRMIVYEGSNFATAGNTALELALTTSVNDFDAEPDVVIFHDGSTLRFAADVSLQGRLRIFNLVGQEVFNRVISQTKGEFQSFEFSGNEGVYIVSFESNNLRFSRKIFVRG